MKRECEKLFHPERFDLHDLTTSISTLEAANPDLGVLFYAQNKQDVSNVDEKKVILEDPKSGEHVLTTENARKYGRSFSQQDHPFHGKLYLVIAKYYVKTHKVTRYKNCYG